MYIAMDMGTSNTRLWLCENDDVYHFVKAEIGAGITKSKGKDFLFREVKNLITNLLEQANVTVNNIDCIIAAGMAGSELGLIDVPRISLPADAYALADNLNKHTLPEISPVPFIFVSGLKKCNGDYIQDIIRGEETETVGIVDSIPLKQDSVIILPGTHNKIISVSKDNEITDFHTTMSGEVLHNVISNSILSGSVGHEFTPNEYFVLLGAKTAKENGINAALFQIRVMSLNGISSNELSSYLYGCILGQDIELIKRIAQNKHVYVGGNETLKSIYCILIGKSAQPIAQELSLDANRKGLSKIFKLYHNINARNDLLKSIQNEKLIAIIRKPDTDSLIPAVNALYNGGLRLVEITFDRSGNTPPTETAKLINLIKANTSMLVGAGTVTSKEELLLAYKAGASYIISPNCDIEIIREARKLGLVSIPAAYTPTEITNALNAGADYIKIFPADDLPKGYIKAIKAPLCDAKLLAVGGVTKYNAKEFIENGFDGIGVGSNLYDKNLIAAKNFKALENLAREYVDAVKKA